MITDILVYIDGRRSMENAVETAFQLAIGHDAHVEGLHVRADARDFISHEPIYSGIDSIRQFSETFDREAAQLEQNAAQAFTEVRDRYGVADAGNGRPGASWNVMSGGTARLVCERARIFDVCVIGRTGYGNSSRSGDITEQVLFDSGRPVLIAPPHVPKSVGRYIVIAWNRSAASAKALSSSVPFLDRADRVRLVYVDTGAKPGPTVDEAAAYLARKGYQAEASTLAVERASVASTLLTDAQHADMLIMGAYSHHRFRDVVLGGVTREIMQNATIPVLMVH